MANWARLLVSLPQLFPPVTCCSLLFWDWCQQVSSNNSYILHLKAQANLFKMLVLSEQRLKIKIFSQVFLLGKWFEWLNDYQNSFWYIFCWLTYGFSVGLGQWMMPSSITKGWQPWTAYLLEGSFWPSQDLGPATTEQWLQCWATPVLQQH